MSTDPLPQPGHPHVPQLEAPVAVQTSLRTSCGEGESQHQQPVVPGESAA